MFSTKLLVFALLWFSCVKCEQCDFSDDECMTAVSNVQFKLFVRGEGCEPSDPLHLDVIEADLATIKYKLNNATLTGMKHCHVELVRINSANHTFDYHVSCPHLVSESEYEVKGHVGPKFIEGTGTCRVDHYDYHFFFRGDFETRTGKNGDAYVQIKTYNLDLDCKGKVQYNFTNLFDGNEELSQSIHRFLDENWRYADKLTRQPAFEAYMEKYISNLNAFMNGVPIKDLFYKLDSY